MAPKTITFDADGYSIIGGKVDVAGGIEIRTTNVGDTSSVSSEITGAGDVIVSGDGRTKFKKSNTYTGTTTVAGGVLVIDANGSVVSDIAVDAGASARITGAATNLSNSGTITITGTVDGDVDNNNSGVLKAEGSITGALVNNGAGVIRVTDALTVDGIFDNNDTGVVNVRDGDLTGITSLTNANEINVGDGVTGRTLSAGTITNELGGTINVQVNSTLQGTGNTLNNDATINVAGGGTLTDAGDINNNAGGIINFNGPGGTATLNSGGTGTIANASGATIDVKSGDVTVGNDDVTTAGDIIVAAGSAMSGLSTLGQTDGDIGGGGTIGVTGTFTQAGAATTTSGAVGLDTGGFVQSGGATIAAGTSVTSTGAQTLQGGTVSGDLDGTGALVVETGTTILTGTISNATSVSVNSGILDVNTGGEITEATTNVGGTITNSGTLAAVTNQAGATFTNEAAGTAGTVSNGGDGTNAGTIASLGNSGAFSNSGSISGNASNSAGTTTNTGAIASTVSISGGVFDQNSGGSIGGAASLSDGTLNANGGTFSTSPITNAGGTVNIAANTTVSVANTSGTLNVSPTATLTGNVDNSGTANLTGTVDGDVDNNSGVLKAEGSITGALVNNGAGVIRVTDALTVDGIFDNNDTGVVNVRDGDLTGITSLTNANEINVGDGVTGRTLSAGTITNELGGTINVQVNSTLQGTGNTLNNDATINVAGGGTLTDAGDINNLTNGDINFQGAAEKFLSIPAGSISNAGSLDFEEGLTTITIGNTFSNASTGSITVSSSATATAIGDILSNLGAVTLNGTGDFTLDTLNNGTGATVSNAGTLTATINNAVDATVGSTGTINGNLANLGVVRAVGVLNGTVENDSGGVFEVSGGTLDMTGDFNNNAAATLDVLSTGIFNPASVTNSVDATINIAGTIGGPVANFGTIDATPGATFTGLVANSETFLGDGTDLFFSGGLVNNGTVNLLAALPAPIPPGGIAPLDRDVLTVGGAGLSGTGIYKLDIDLQDSAAGAEASDRIQISDGSVATGSYLFEFNAINGGGRQAENILVLKLDATQANSIDNFDQVGLPNTGGKYLYSLFQEDVTGNLVVNSQLNPAIPALSANITLTQSLIGSVINRPSSPFVVGLAAQEVDPCGAGGWFRAIGGQADATGSSFNADFNFESTLNSTYSGVQAGGDFGCFNGFYNGWDMAFGGIVGLNNGQSTQPVFAINSLDPSKLDPRQTSLTTVDFDQTYGGGYITAAKGQFTADLQLRYESTDFTANNVALAGQSGLGLKKSNFGSQAKTLSGSVSYSFPLGENGVSLSPAIGFAATNTSTDDVIFDNGDRLVLDNSQNRTGFLGASLANTTVGSDGLSLISNFVTLTVYNDFASDPTMTFVDSSGSSSTTNMTTQNLGAYGEISAGVSYVKLLDPGRAGNARQLNASIRADGRFSNRLDSWGLTAQVRLQF